MYIIWALIRGFSTTLKAALRPVPALLAVLVVVFTTSDAWRLFGLESYWRFTIMIAIVLGLSLSALAVGLRDSDGGWREVLGYSDSDPRLLESWAKQTPAEDLSASVQPLLPLGGGIQGRTGQNFELRPPGGECYSSLRIYDGPAYFRGRILDIADVRHHRRSGGQRSYDEGTDASASHGNCSLQLAWSVIYAYPPAGVAFRSTWRGGRSHLRNGNTAGFQ